ncbi:MAG: hypothetical protein EAZ83_00020, partial [Oscillatoriales cyanobacterium]
MNGVERAQEPIESSIPTPTFGALCDRPTLGLQDVVDLLEARGASSLAVGDCVEMGEKASVKSRTLVKTSDSSFTLFWDTETDSTQAVENLNGVESVTCAIEQAIEPSKFGRIVYPKPIAPATETSPGVEIESEAEEYETDLPTTFSERFLSLYAPPSFSSAHAVESDGQLKLLERVVDPEPPDPDSDAYSTPEQFWSVMKAWDAAYDDGSYEQFSDFPEKNNGELNRASTESVGADEIAIGTGLPSECDNRAQLHGTGGHNQDEGL